MVLGLGRPGLPWRYPSEVIGVLLRSQDWRASLSKPSTNQNLKYRISEAGWGCGVDVVVH